MNAFFWSNRSVLVTGHTGFKGSWLTLWLRQWGAAVTGFALPPESQQSLYHAARIGDGIVDARGDVQDLRSVTSVIARNRPEIIFHLAAQPLVRRAYAKPVETFATNVMGTVNVLEAARQSSAVRAVVVVTSDKCYAPTDDGPPHCEDDRLGGHEPYSASKACAELVTDAYRRSFFLTGAQARPVGVATVRAGNVIGGGDWSRDRLVPDALRAFLAGDELLVRSPHAVRPWQHVLEPLSGYLRLAEQLYQFPEAFSRGWNFGPDEADAVEVAELVRRLAARWPGARWRTAIDPHAPAETAALRLDSTLAARQLNWTPRLTLDQTLDLTVAWYRAAAAGADMADVTTRQLASYQRLLNISGAPGMSRADSRPLPNVPLVFPFPELIAETAPR